MARHENSQHGERRCPQNLHVGISEMIIFEIQSLNIGSIPEMSDGEALKHIIVHDYILQVGGTNEYIFREYNDIVVWQINTNQTIEVMECSGTQWRDLVVGSH